MSAVSRYGAFVALLPGLQAQGNLMSSVGAAISIARLAPRVITAGNDVEGLFTGLAKDNSLIPAIDSVAVLARSLAGLMADPAQQPLVMAFLKSFDTET